MGLTTGPVPARIDGDVKAGLLLLIDHAETQGWSRCRAAVRLGLAESRQRRWDSTRQAGGDLTDAVPGGNPLHGRLPEERDAIIQVHEGWGEIDRSHRKLAHRGSRLGRVHVSESTVLRVLQQAGLSLPGTPRREPVPRTPFPDWLVWKPNRIWAYDYTHFPRAKRAAVAAIDVVSRKWLATLVSVEETSTQVESVFCDALESEDLLDISWDHGSADLRVALANGDRDTIDQLAATGDVPLLLAISDNGPQMKSVSTREFLAGVAIAQQFGRPGTPTDQAWIETLFGHVKGEHPHLELITDPAELEAELGQVRTHYNTVRLHAGIGYVTPDDEHEGRGEGLRQARRLGLQQARQHRIEYRRHQQADTP